MRGDAGQEVVAGEEPAEAGGAGRGGRALLGGVRLLQVEADVAGGVARRPDRPDAAAGQVEEFAGLDGPVRQGGPPSGQLAAAPGGAGGPQRLQVVVRRPGRGELDEHVVEPLPRFGRAAAPDHRGVRGVHGDPRAGGLPHRGGEPVVVGVVVGDHHPVDVGGVEAAGGDAGGEGVPGVRVVPAGVDQDRSAVGLQEVDEGVAEGVVRDGDGDAPHPALVVDHLRCHGYRPLPRRRGELGFGGGRGLHRVELVSVLLEPQS